MGAGSKLSPLSVPVPVPVPPPFPHCHYRHRCFHRLRCSPVAISVSIVSVSSSVSSVTGSVTGVRLRTDMAVIIVAAGLAATGRSTTNASHVSDTAAHGATSAPNWDKTDA